MVLPIIFFIQLILEFLDLTNVDKVFKRFKDYQKLLRSRRASKGVLRSELHHGWQILPSGDASLLPGLQHRLLAQLRLPVHLDSEGICGGVRGLDCQCQVLLSELCEIFQCDFNTKESHLLKLFPSFPPKAKICWTPNNI